MQKEVSFTVIRRARLSISTAVHSPPDTSAPTAITDGASNLETALTEAGVPTSGGNLTLGALEGFGKVLGVAGLAGLAYRGI